MQLELASFDEIVEELSKRDEHLAIVVARRSETPGFEWKHRVRFQGEPLLLMGLIDRLHRQVSDELEHRTEAADNF